MFQLQSHDAEPSQSPWSWLDKITADKHPHKNNASRITKHVNSFSLLLILFLNAYPTTFITSKTKLSSSKANKSHGIHDQLIDVKNKHDLALTSIKPYTTQKVGGNHSTSLRLLSTSVLSSIHFCNRGNTNLTTKQAPNTTTRWSWIKKKKRKSLEGTEWRVENPRKKIRWQRTMQIQRFKKP